MGRFVDVSDDTHGLAIVNDGLREYEVTDTPERRLKITLMRAFQIELATVSWRWERHPEMPLSQSPGAHSFTYRIMPHSGSWADARVFAEVDRLNLPLEVAQTCAHGGDLPQELSFFSIGPIDLVLSGMKTAEDGNGYIVRCFNPTDTEQRGTLSAWKSIEKAELERLDEKSDKALTPNGKHGRVRSEAQRKSSAASGVGEVA